MKSFLIIALACVVAQAHSPRIESTGPEGVLDRSKQQAANENIDKAAAINIARQHAEQTYGSLQRYGTVVCEQAFLWRVFFDPENGSGNKSGLEYIVTKRGGKILNERKLPLPRPGSQERAATSAVDRKAAVAISKKDGRKAYGSLSRYAEIVCELSNVWIVIFSLEGKMDGGGPEYVIDKQTGDILDKKYYQ